MSKYTLSPELIAKIEKILSQGDRVELIPCKDNIKAVQEKRNIAAQLPERSCMKP